MTADIRTRRKQNDNIHFENTRDDDFIHENEFSKGETQTNSETPNTFWGEFDGDKENAVVPAREQIRRRLNSTLLINLFLGFVVFIASAATLAYCFWYFGRMTVNGLKNVLVVLIVQGNSLISVSLLGLCIYKEKNSSWMIQLLFSAVLIGVMTIFIVINLRFPNTETLIKSFSSELNKYQELLTNSAKDVTFSRSRCCNQYGFRNNCYDPNEKPFTSKDPAMVRIFESMDDECFKLMGWAMAETLIKSCSCFLVPALFLIILINSLIHFASSFNSGFVRISETEAAPGIGANIL